MAMRAGPRMPVGSAAWIAEERSSALQIAQSEIEEFSFSARNEVDWLKEHMAEIFSENPTNVAELFKTPGKLRGKTPRTAKKTNPAEARVPLSDVFSTTPKGAPNAFAKSLLHAQQHGRTPQFKVAEDKPKGPDARPASPAKTAVASPRAPAPVPAQIPITDSGYHGSQEDMEPYQHAKDTDATVTYPTLMDVDTVNFATAPISMPPAEQQTSPTAVSMEDTFQSAKEEQTRPGPTGVVNMASPRPLAPNQQSSPAIMRKPVGQGVASSSPKKASPAKLSLRKESPVEPAPVKPMSPPMAKKQVEPAGKEIDEELGSPSDESSSPVRPIIRKSSLNFASLPAREPLTSNKSLGARISQTRTSYYNRLTGGKSLGANVVQDTGADQDDQDEMDLDDPEEVDSPVTTHSKTYAQRLHEQISMLGKSQPADHRTSKSLASHLPMQQTSAATASQPAHSQHQQPSQAPKAPASPAVHKPATTPGAFPDDDEDDWIAPPPKHRVPASPRPALAKSHATEVMEGLEARKLATGSEFVLPKSRPGSPRKAPVVPERTTSTAGHSKSASVPSLPLMDINSRDSDMASLKKTISVSNPTLATVTEDGSQSPPKSPSRTFRESPLKQVKNKFSSFLKGSKSLLASSAAISAEAKAAILSPSTTRLGFHPGASVDSFRTAENVLYPDLSHHQAPQARPESPSRSTSTRKTRASAERERREAKEREKEMKEAKRQAEQMDKLEKLREKEREKARVFSKEQEKIMEMEKQMAAQREQERLVQKEQERIAQAQAAAAAEAQAQAAAAAAAQAQAKASEQAAAAREIPSSPPKSPAKPTRTSPRKAKAQLEAEAKAAAENDVEMADAASAMPPPSLPRSATTTGQGPKRTAKPPKELPKPKQQPPTVIRVIPGSSQHSQFLPSNSTLAANLKDTLGSQQQSQPRQLTSKASIASLHTKPSIQSLKSSTGKPRALELAAKRKEQEERDAQRKREAKLELNRKRAAQQEEDRREQQRKVELEKQKEDEKKQAAAAAAQAKKDAQRQAALEKAKQTRAPPPAARTQPNGPPDYSAADKGPARPPSRLGSMLGQDSSRPVNAVLSNAAKMASKRPLQQDANDDARAPPSRNNAAYQSKEAGKRIRLSEDSDSDTDMMDSQPGMKAQPVRFSAGMKMELPNTKSTYNTTTTSASQHGGVTRDLFKTAVTSQHMVQTKVTHPNEMAQFAKGAIPFAPNPSAAAGPSTYKTPARPGAGPPAKSAAKSATRSSPRFQNGEAIELPDIQTDDEDEEDETQFGVAAWANSPFLNEQILRQENVDPTQIFGPPRPLALEEVFKDKNTWHRFRARTSSANWSGSDRLTEEEIRKDLQARDKMRREGGWSYELSKELS